MTASPPPAPTNLEELDELLSRPGERVIECMRRLKGDLLLLGVGGKMGPTLARMARRACEAAGVARRIVGVSRFSVPGLREQLEGWGIDTISCDLLKVDAVAGLELM